MIKHVSYLHKINYDPKLDKSIVSYYLKQPRLLILLVLSIVFIGLASYISLPRVLNPNIKIPLVIINTLLPGANPKDVESLVTIPVEDSMSGVAKVKKVTSSSRDSVSTVQVEFDSGVDPDKARTDVQSAVDSVVLPTDAKTPKVIKLDFQNEPIWTFTVTSQGSDSQLMTFARELKKKLENASTIDKADISGLETEEIQILLKTEAIATYKISPFQLAQSIKSALNALPAGAVKTEISSFGLSVNAGITSIEDVRNVRLNLNGTIVPLSDIATISQRPGGEQTPAYIATNNGTSKRAVTFYVFKTSSTNIDAAVKDARKVVSDSLQHYHNQFKVWDVLDVSKSIDTQFNDLLRDFSITVGLIFITLFIFLGGRQAIVAAVTTPLTFLIVFTIMNMTGVPISFISLFSLLLALGLLVDDTIVVISAMTAYHRAEKFSPYETGRLVWRDFSIPILTTTITTVWAFVPLLLATGIIGEFIKAIPIVASTALIASIFVAMLVTLPLIIFLLKPTVPYRLSLFLRIIFIILAGVFFLSVIPKSGLYLLTILIAIVLLFVTYHIRKQLVTRLLEIIPIKHFDTAKEKIDDGFISFEPITTKYHSIIESILSSKQARRTTLIIVTIFCLFSYTLLPLGFVVNEFFPKSDQDYVYVSLELPSGTSLQNTKQEALKVGDELRRFKGVQFVSINIGEGLGSNGGASVSGENTVLYSLLLQDKPRKTTSIDLGEQIRNEYKNYSKGQLSVTESTGGPPAGADVQINLYGDDLNKLGLYATQIQNFMKKQQGLANIDRSIKTGTGKIVFTPNLDKMAENNITQDIVGLWLRTYASGFTLGNLKIGGESYDITVRTTNAALRPENISSIVIPTQTTTIPLIELGTIQLEPNPTLITREDGKRTMSVTATTVKGYSTSILNQKVLDYVKTLPFDSGYGYQTGGVNEQNQESVTSILQAMVLSFLLILTTMVIQFSSFRKAIIVMLVIPLSISGVFIMFALLHIPLSFPALIGVLALFGIVVKNSILIVDKINQNLKIGLPFKTSIADGASSRLEAIALTSFTAIIGLIPITLSDPVWRGLGGAIISGLLFSGTIMLFFIPVVYYIIFVKHESKLND